MKKLLYLLIITCVSCSENNEKIIKNASSFPIGSSVRINSFLKDTVLVNIQKKHFNSITSGNDMKMYTILKSENDYNWERVDKLLNYAQENNQRFFCHNLIWHFSTPNWILEKAIKA
tara:strand:- start:1438 stop:1788 length:351 start_codon:yes stop_codon:yes gene_type:complete